MSVKVLLTPLVILWASPYTLIGVLIGTAGLCTGGRAKFCTPAIEFHGGAVKWFLERLPRGKTALAFTLGHSILGKSADAIDIVRDHEHVHVRQYERWGFLMGPAYLLCSLFLWMRGRDAYGENPFEREAYGEDHE